MVQCGLQRGYFMTKMKKPSLDSSLQASSNEGSSFGDHPERIAQFGELKKRSREMGKYILSGGTNKIKIEAIDGRVLELDPKKEQRLGHNILGCANYLRFNHYYTVDQVKLVGAITCKKHMLCPFCARARAAKMVQRYKERFDIVLDDKPTLIPVFLTLTVKNGSDLDERFNHLKKSYKKLLDRRRKFLNNSRGHTELVKSEGGIHSFEVTNIGNGWHPHIHSILLLNEYIDIKLLREEWEKITGDSCNVDIRVIPKKGDGSIIEALLEVFKYALKFSDLSLEKNYFAYQTLKGQRLQSAYGCLWGIKIPASDLEDPLTGLPYLELYYRFLNGAGYSLEKTLKKSGSEDCLLNSNKRVRGELIEGREQIYQTMKEDKKNFYKRKSQYLKPDKNS